VVVFLSLCVCLVKCVLVFIVFFTLFLIILIFIYFFCNSLRTVAS